MPDVVATLAGREARQTFAEQRPERVKRSTAGLANDGFEFGETELDGVEVGAIGGQEPERGAGRFNGQEPAQLGMTQVLTRDDPGMRLARAPRLTGRATGLGRAEARSAVRERGVSGGSHVRPTRTTETGPRDARPHTGATSLQTCLVFSAPRPRPSKSPGIHRKNSGPPLSDPGVRASAGLGGGGGSLERTRLARRQANTRRIRESRISPRISRFRIFDRLGVVVETAGNAIEVAPVYRTGWRLS